MGKKSPTNQRSGNPKQLKPISNMPLTSPPANSNSGLQPQNLPPFRRRLRIALKKQWAFILGTCIVAGGWYFQNFKIEKNNAEKQDLIQNMNSYWREQQSANENDWRYIFLNAQDTGKNLPDSIKQSRLIMADAEELEAYNAMHLTGYRILYSKESVDGKDSIEQAENDFVLNSKLHSRLFHEKKAEELEYLLHVDNTMYEDWDTSLKSDVGLKTKEIDDENEHYRLFFLVCVIVGTILITFNKAMDYVKGVQPEKSP